MISEREVGTEEGLMLAKSLNIPFMETSAKIRINIEESFFELVRLMALNRASKIWIEKGNFFEKKKKSNCLVM